MKKPNAAVMVASKPLEGEYIPAKRQSRAGSLITAVAVTFGTFATTANAALLQADVDAVVAEVTADAGIAIAAGFSVLAVVLAATIGFSLVGRFISKGANGG